jgi:Acetyltransferases, including N-acetylases of ribosomal proteins
MGQIQIETPRLFLRPIELNDSAAILKYRSDAVANQFQGWIPSTVEDVHHFINHRVSPEIDRAGTWFQMVIIRKDSDELIGDMGIHFHEEQPYQVELGITLNKHQQGQGFAAEALREVIRYLFLKLAKQKIVVSIDPRNRPSRKLFERLGFVQEALYEKSFFLNGEWVDDLVMGLANDELNYAK